MIYLLVITLAVVETIVDNLKISAKPQYVDLIYRAYQLGAHGGWLMDELALIGLTSHMLAFLNRLELNTPLSEPIGSDLVEQIDQCALRLAERILQPICDHFEVPLDRSEVALVALHLAAARERLRFDSSK